MDPQNQVSTARNVITIPPNVIARVDKDSRPKFNCHLLHWNGRLIVLQTPPVENQCQKGYRGYAETPEMWPLVLKSHQERMDQLEIAQTLLGSIDLGKSNWIYMVPTGSNGTYRLLQKDYEVYQLKCPLWAPLIDESEVQIYCYFQQNVRFGIWRGRDVDIITGWNDFWMRKLEQETMARRAMKDLDLSFEVLGHLVRDGRAVGLLVEAPQGRMIEYSDKSLVYDAFSTLYNHKVLNQGGLGACNIMIHNGKVRLTYSLCTLKDFTSEDDATVAEAAELGHWKALEEMFEELQRMGACNLIPPYRFMTQAIIPLNPPPSPEKNLPQFLLFEIDVSVAQQVSDKHEQNYKQRMLARSSSTRRFSMLVSEKQLHHYVSHMSRSQRSELGARRAEEVRYMHFLPPFRAGFHPYRRRNGTVFISPYDDNDATSDSGASSCTLAGAGASLI